MLKKGCMVKKKIEICVRADVAVSEKNWYRYIVIVNRPLQQLHGIKRNNSLSPQRWISGVNLHSRKKKYASLWP
jgi:hypothetical protein